MAAEQHEITILGQKFIVRTDASADDVRAVADRVQAVMTDISVRSPSLNQQQVAILAALNLAEQDLKRRREFAGLVRSWRQKLSGWVRKAARS